MGISKSNAKASKMISNKAAYRINKGIGRKWND